MTNDVIFDERSMSSVVLQGQRSPLVSLLIKSGLVHSEVTARVTLLASGAVFITLALFIFLRTVNDPGINPERDIPPLSRTSAGQQ
ncbi:MAG: hypothetical protein NUW02_01670 [Candidatus Campbellbacteria bacterium]|nr:hypothetical protein [Candidatus Campbellbacteria bacterium]